MNKTHQLLKIIIWIFVISAAMHTSIHQTIAGKIDKTKNSMGEAEIQSPPIKNMMGESFSESDSVAEATASLHVTGQPQNVDIKEWRLEVRGEKLGNPLTLSYDELLEMEQVKKNVVLVCPGFFRDIADWEGVPLRTLLEMAQVSEDYKRVEFQGLDGYMRSLSKKEVEEHLVFLAIKVNNVTLPREHGYPVRLVAENITGGTWVKWLYRIEVK